MSIDRDTAPTGWIGLRRLPKESELRAVLVTLIVCLACSATIAVAVSVLGPYRDANRVSERQARVRQMIGSVPGLDQVLGEATGDAGLEARIVDLETGRYATEIDPENFDPTEASRDPELSIALAREDDPARLGRRARHARIYLVSDRSGLRLVVLPVEGGGYASTLRGYLALDSDLRTIRGLSFYEHAETPGLGSEIDDPEWRARWPGKLAFDAAGDAAIEVLPGRVDPSSPAAPYQVDGISGATRTGDGVTELLRFWLGPLGFGPYLEGLAQSSANPIEGTSR